MVSPVRGNLLRHRRLCGCFDVLPGDGFDVTYQRILGVT